MNQADLDTLHQLRQRFLSNRAEGGYWRSHEELALYDRTFGERIGWKWDGVLRELTARGWQPEARTLLDWGCGSGVASRRVLAQWPDQFEAVHLYDSSSLARAYARGSVQALDAALQVREVEIAVSAPETLVLLSHVLNELTDEQAAALVQGLSGVQEIIWVESGTHANSRRLIAEVRERLLSTGTFQVVAPCPHREQCGMLHPQRARDWCHSFASPPREIFQDREWMHFGRELGIDLRSTPYAFLVLRRVAKVESGVLPFLTPAGAARVIGRSRDYKGYSKVLSCEASGVPERMLQKRDAPELLKQVQAGKVAAPVYQWSLEKERIVGGGAVFK